MLRRLAVLAFALLCGGTAQASPHCRLYDPNYLRCVRDREGLHPAAWFARRGDALIRVVDAGMTGGLVIDVVLPKSGPGRVMARDRADYTATQTYRFARARFEALRRLVRGLKGAGAVLHGGTPAAEHVDRRFEDMPCIVTTESWAEVALDGRGAAASLPYCTTDDSGFVDDVERFVVALDPVCAGVWPQGGDPARSLRPCLHLRGDRARAAAAYRASYLFTDWSPGAWNYPAPDDAALAAMLAPDAVLRFSDGEPVARGAAIVTRLRVLAKDMSFDTVEARATATGATVRGTVAHQFFTSARELSLFEAPYEQVWRFDAAGTPRLAQWRIGPFKQQP